MPSRFAWTSVVFVAVVMLLPAAQGATQPADTYPPGVLSVTHTPVKAAKDFQATVETDASAGFERAAMAICRFRSLEEETPQVCYTQIPASRQGAQFMADSADGEHPRWSDGWVIGYKFTLLAGEEEVHVPADGNYYRLEVGMELDETADPITAQNADVEKTDGGKGAPFPLPVVAIVAAGLLRRR